jgi:hypothetical protein
VGPGEDEVEEDGDGEAHGECGGFGEESGDEDCGRRSCWVARVWSVVLRETYVELMQRMDKFI